MRISCNQGIRKNQSYLLGEVSTINFFHKMKAGLSTALSFKRVELQIQSRGKTVGTGNRDCISNTSLFATRLFLNVRHSPTLRGTFCTKKRRNSRSRCFCNTADDRNC
ncbi:hypothetical protein BDFB_008541 [Asbolus verrucosus]|uniref:Uncharacterized protein n=1 Tax=Asbolus verrucosus TaxID=1661398 RepID=A0A482VIK4_ASBVE|nr:hypothetical protein BDFB_008541 [Asbolus verrucosus]